MIITKIIDFKLEDVITLDLFVAYDESELAQKSKLPTVLTFHDYAGRKDFDCQKAKSLAELGYVGVACNVYGKGVAGTDPETNMKLMRPFIDDRQMLGHRLRKIVEAVKNLDVVDPGKIAAIGFCFGGMCVLDIARNNLGLAGVVSFHGALTSPEYPIPEKIDSKVLVLHGDADFHIKPEHVDALKAELNKKQCDWQLVIYGHTYHSFTNPAANDKTRGVAYDHKADKRSWKSMENFLQEIFQ